MESKSSITIAKPISYDANRRTEEPSKKIRNTGENATNSPHYEAGPLYNPVVDDVLRKIKQFVDSVQYEKPPITVQDKTEYIPRLDLISEDIKQALQNGTAEIIPCKDFN